MKNIMKSRYISFILALFMVVGVFLPQGRVFADNSGKYTINLRIDVNEKEKLKEKIKGGGVIKSSARQVKVYKLKLDEHITNSKLIELAQSFYRSADKELNIADVEKKLNHDKILIQDMGKSKTSKLVYDNVAYDEIDTRKIENFDVDKLSEQILIDNLDKGFYLIKEIDESKKILNKQLVPSIVRLPDDETNNNIRTVIAKEVKKVKTDIIKLIKVDADNKNIRINKAQFKLYQKIKDGNEVKSIPVKVTGEKGKYIRDDEKGADINLETWDNGEIIVSNLLEGVYYFKEVAPAPGYDKANVGKISEDLKPGGEPFVIKNKITPILKKIDAADKNKYLKDAVFKLYKKDGTVLKFKKAGVYYELDNSGKEEIVTDDNGLIYISDLKDGDYYFEETKAPKGYQLSKTKIEFKVKNARAVNDKGEIKILIVENTPDKPNPKTPTGGFNFVKIDDSKDEKRLSGARFVLMKLDEKTNKYERVVKDGKQITLESGNNGEFRVDGLEYGRYALREEAAPVNYYIDNPLTYFDVDAASISLPAKKIVNKPYKPVITSRDNTTVTKYVPTNATTVIKNIVKTGDVKIIIMAIAGLILLTMGIKLVNSSEKLQMA